MVRALPYLPVEELGDRPHVLVDGATRPGSVLTLSHWPQSQTPKALARDLSAQIVFALLHAPDGAGARGGGGRPAGEIRRAVASADRAEAVTNDHFDEDGLVSVFAMTDPDAALSHEEVLVEAASCGDFGVVRSRRAARIAFSIGPMGEQLAEGAAGSGVVPGAPGTGSGPRYRAVLERTIELLEHPERFRRFWQEEDADLGATLDDLRAGAVQIEDVPEVDLAVVTRVGAPRPGGSAVGSGPRPLHQVAIHSATPASRILVLDGARCELYLRYEGWVRYMSRHVPLRPDLAPLAAQLSILEAPGVEWVADGVGSIVTRLRPEPAGVSDLDRAVIRGAVVGYLRRAAPAWDPFRRGSPLIPVR